MRCALFAAAALFGCSNPLVGAGARLEWQPRAHSFPQIAVGSSTTADLVLKNSGARAVTVSTIHLAAGSSPAFRVVGGAPAEPVPLRPGEERRVTVRYAPTEIGEARGTLTAVTSVGEVSAVLSNLPPAPRIELEPPAIDFGVVLQGQRAERELRIRNAGTAPLTVRAIALSAATHGDFRLDLGATVLPATLDILQERRVLITFAPSGPGSRGGAVEVLSDDRRTPIATCVLASGESVPRISIDPTELRFGAVEQGHTKSLPVRVTNAGTAELRVTPSVSGSGDFRVQSGERVVAPNAVVEVAVTYAPTDVGIDRGTLTLAHNDPSQGPVAVALTGGAQPSILLSPFGIQFTNVVQFSSAEQEVVISNAGYGDLVLGTIAFGSGPGESHPDYTLTGVPAVGTTLARGRTATFTVRYEKTTAGNPTAAIYVSSNDPDPTKNPFPLYVVAVGGVSDPPPTASIACTNCSGSTLQGALPATVLLDGTGSRDPGGQPLTYSWALLGSPAGSQAVIEDPVAAQTRFTADVAGPYRVSLIVQDASGQQSPRVTKDLSVLP
jgi:hypothetical protein